MKFLFMAKIPRIFSNTTLLCRYHCTALYYLCYSSKVFSERVRPKIVVPVCNDNHLFKWLKLAVIHSKICICDAYFSITSLHSRSKALILASYDILHQWHIFALKALNHRLKNIEQKLGIYFPFQFLYIYSGFPHLPSYHMLVTVTFLQVFGYSCSNER